MASDVPPPETKAEIAGAVRDALAKHGYARLTTSKIAAESDKSEAGLYYYYDSKDDMIVAFLETASDYLVRELEAVEAAGPEETLRAACDRLVVREENADDRGVDVAMMELLSHAPYDEEFRERLLTLERTTLDHLAGIVADGVETGVFRDVEPRATATFLLAAARGSTPLSLALGMDEAGRDLHEQVQDYIDSLVVD